MSNRRQNKKRELRQTAETNRRLRDGLRKVLGLPAIPEQPKAAPRKTIRALENP